MAGAGYKLFNTGDVLTAAQVNTYLQEQVVMVFANATARTTALSGVLSEGMISYLQDTNAVEVYNGSAWTAVGGGGLTSPLTTKGDVWGYSTTNARIPVGSNGTVLTADSAETLGVKWASPSSGALTKIHSSTFSAVSSKSVTDCFSSTYENYKVIFIVNAGTNSASMKLRFSSSGTDNSSALYFTGSGGSRSDGSFAPIASGPTATSADIARIENNSTQFQMLCLDVINPQLAKRTSFTMVGAIQDGTSPVGIGGGGGFNDNTQFQGITFFPTAGTMTGSIAIYGYEK